MRPGVDDHESMTNPASRLDWLLFIVLGFLWGSSYLFIKIGVEAGLPPFTLVALRLLLGFGLLAAVVALSRVALPREPRVYRHLFVMALVNIVVPFSLITWAEQRVDSTIASTLNGAVPILVIPIAALVLRDEPLRAGRVVGVILGFLGLAVVVGFDPSTAARTDLAGALALIGSTTAYAVGAVYARRNVHGLRPMIPALFQVGFALAVAAVLALVVDRPWERAVEPQAILAILWLGFLGSGVAYLLFFNLLARRGAAGTSAVAYLLPVFGVLLGALVLHEPVDAGLLIGLALIIGGIALVNTRFQARPVPAPERPVTAGERPIA
jgi:drug/metabolite transporter (DMT)-like permease